MMMMGTNLTSLLLILCICCSSTLAHVQRQGLVFLLYYYIEKLSCRKETMRLLGAYAGLQLEAGVIRGPKGRVYKAQFSQRAEVQDPTGRERLWGSWERQLAPPAIRSLGERCKFRQRSPGRSPGRQMVFSERSYRPSVFLSSVVCNVRAPYSGLKFSTIFLRHLVPWPSVTFP